VREVCVCVCGERERARARERETETVSLYSPPLPSLASITRSLPTYIDRWIDINTQPCGLRRAGTSV
jgi:hypothetical protein